MFRGLFAVYVCEFVASLATPRRGRRRWQRALGFVRIAVGLWLMYLTVAATLNVSHGFNLPL